MPVFFLILTFFISHLGYAADFEDFVGGVSNTRVTANPASVGLVGRVHFQYNGMGYTSERESSILTEHLRLGDDSVQTIAPDKTNLIDRAGFSNALHGESDIKFIYPLEWISIGISSQAEHHQRKGGFFITPDDVALLEEENKTDLTEEIQRSRFGYLIGIPFKFFSLGVRYIYHNGIHEVKRFNPSFILGEENPNVIVESTQPIKIKGKVTEYSQAEYGILIPNLLPNVDLGIVHRPSVEGTMTFDDSVVPDTSPEIGLEDVRFDEPSLTQIGLGFIIEMGRLGAFQLIGDVGTFGEISQDFEGNTGESVGPQGALGRLVLGRYIDVSYGTQSYQLAGVRFERITTSFQIPFFPGSNLKLGTQTLKISQDGDTLVDATFPKISFNFQTGGARQSKALVVPPKTKEITFIDRL